MQVHAKRRTLRSVTKATKEEYSRRKPLIHPIHLILNQKRKKMEIEEVWEVLADFMGMLDCNFEVIIHRLSESPHWKVMDNSICRIWRCWRQRIKFYEMNAMGGHYNREVTEWCQGEGLDLTPRSIRDNIVVKKIQESREEYLEQNLKDIDTNKLKISRV